jgi:hypothetical protein
MSVRTRGGKLWLQGGRVPTRESNLRAPTNADLGFVESSFTALTDQASGTYLFTVQVLNADIFTLQGYSFSNFRRTAGFSKLTGGTATATSRPFTSNTMVLGDADAVTVTVSVDFTGPTSGTLSAAIPGLIEAPPGSGIVVHQFTLHNTSSGSAVTPRARFGLAFESGAFPDNFKIKVRDQATQADVAFAAMAATNSWADDSFRSTADGGLVMEDSNTIAAGGSRTYEAYITNGGQSASGFGPWTWIAASDDDLTVAVTSRTGSASGSLGNLTFSLQTAIATTTRREILCDTERFVRVKAWQKVSGEEHLICEFHVDFWLDGAGDPVGLEVATVLTQHWHVDNPFGITQTKELQTYSATVAWGSTTLDTRTGLAHAYNCRWASLRSANDAQHARKHWINLGATMPTVRVQYADSSLKAMMRAGYIPSLTINAAYADVADGAGTVGNNGSGLVSTYTPLDRNGHRTKINGTGGYIGRGIWGHQDASLLSRQSDATAAKAELAWRRSRVMAQAGLSMYSHTRDHRSASNVNGGTDTTNRLMPGGMRNSAAVDSQSYTGLASACIRVRGATVENSGGNATGYPTVAHSAPVGGTGSMNSYDFAHAHNYCAPMAWLEGEAYLGDAAMSQLDMTTLAANFNAYGHDAAILYYFDTVRRASQSIPATRQGTVVPFGGQERDMAWMTNLLMHGYAVCASNRPEAPYVKNVVKHSDHYLSKSFDYYPTAHRNKGVAWFNQSTSKIISPWMCCWQGLAAYQAARVMGDILPDNGRGMNAFEEMAHLSARYAIGMVSTAPYSALAYRAMLFTDNGALTFIPDDEWPMGFPGAWSGGVGTYVPPFGLTWKNGDKVRFGSHNQNYATQTLPTGVTATTLYYMVNVSGNTFQVSLTEGGAPVSVGNIASVVCYITMADFSTAALGPNGTRYWPGDDSEMTMTFGLFELAIGEGHADMTNEIRDAGRAWFANRKAAISTFASWNYDGGNLT